MSTGQGLLGYNMYAYCLNNPMNRVDYYGHWSVWDKIKEFFSDTFGAGVSSTGRVEYNTTEHVPSVFNWLVTVTTGSYVEVVESTLGNSDKPISVNANYRTDNPWLSSASLSINIDRFNLSFNLGLEDTGVSGTWHSDDESNTIGASADIYNAKVGFESANTKTISENSSQTVYTNTSITFMGICGLLYYKFTGDPSYLPEFAG